MTPATEAALLQRADALVGATVGELAASLGRTAPRDLRRHKGFVGQLVEQALGAVAGSRSEPDFPHLGIELKTVPVDPAGRPVQSTWVCTAPVGSLAPPRWWSSPVRARLARVLWQPVEGWGVVPDRTFGIPVLWSPTPEQEEILFQDYTTLTELLADGEVWQWTARHGVALQLRPKAASSRDRIEVTDAEGEIVETVPLGFYLRRSFTTSVLSGG
jgi:DNA mismatch repair protein MutH